ncbi:MAG: acyl-CoA dehydrogenase N-terminal domain-containing protein, partial [Paracoccaceae bacterium]|nr:acyl-CoA dehydrogenase N-terminal domain-containing protein [Paracoccaceae bacterium]
MPAYTAPTKDIQFLLHDVLKISESSVAGFADLDRDTTGAIIDEAGKLASDVLAPL